MPEIKIVDHKDGNGLNNRRSNLRQANKSQNGMNRLPNQKKETTKFKGIWFCKFTGRWRASITLNGKKIHLGRFDNEVEAARAYDMASLEYFGEFARTNKMMGLYD